MTNPHRLLIPAGGRAARFNGLPKELFPIDRHGTPSLAATVATGRMLFPVGGVTVVTRADRIATHARVCPTATFVIQGRKELWGAIRDGIQDADGPVALMLPDTVLKISTPPLLTHPLEFGVFQTNTPERFSTFKRGRLVTKGPNVLPALAWGVVRWNREVTAFLKTLNVDTYDEAFNAAIKKFDMSHFLLSSFHDIGTPESYWNYVRSV
jgi:hypothetical protein